MNKGLLERNIMVGNALVDMYAKSGVLALANQVLENLPNQNMFTWKVLKHYAWANSEEGDGNSVDAT